MAKKDIVRLKNTLTKVYITKFEEIESSLHEISKISLVDPDDMEMALKMLREISTYISNINSTLFMAENYIKEFYRVLGSQVLLDNSLKEAHIRVAEQVEDQGLADMYLKKRSEIRDTVKILVCTKEFLCLPNSRKNRRKWEIRKPGSIKFEYGPFVELDSKLSSLSEFIITNFC